MKSSRERTTTARPLIAMLVTAAVLWVINGLVMAFVSFSLPSGYPPGAPWAENWSRLVGLSTNLLVVQGAPALALVVGLLLWWRTGSSPWAARAMALVCLIWWVVLLVVLLVSGVPLAL